MLRALAAIASRVVRRPSHDVLPVDPGPTRFGPPPEPPPPVEGYAYRTEGHRHTVGVERDDPLGAWKRHAYARGDLFREYIVPRVVMAPATRDFAFAARPPRLPPEEIEEGFRALAPWTYHVEAGGRSTRAFGSYSDRTIAFHRYRANLITRTVRAMLGEAAASATLLDLGCNCGFFTLDAAARGIGHATGIDLRPENIAQAEFLARLFGLSAVEFRLGNVKTALGGSGRHDVILNLGLMYHLSTPFEVLRSCFEATGRFCVVDTITHSEPVSAFHVVGKDPGISIEGDLAFELQPTYRGIIDTMRLAGFRDIVELDAPTDDIELYADGSRRCLVGFRDEAAPYLARLLGDQ